MLSPRAKGPAAKLRMDSHKANPDRLVLRRGPVQEFLRPGRGPPWRPSTGYMLSGADRSLEFAWLPPSS